MALGSGQFSSPKAQKPHLLAGSGGLASEVADLRADIKKDFLSNAAIAVEEFTDPPAAGVALISAVAQSQVAAGRSAVLLPLAANISPPRNITVSTGAGGTPADAPATVVVTGKDINGAVQTETLNISQTAATVAGVKAFASVTSIVEAAGEGTGAALSYGIGALIGLGKPLKTRAGLVAVIREVAVGAVVTNGTFALPAASPPNGTYSPNSAADGSRDYALYYEYDAALNGDA
jgi:hypothetical protein